MNLSRMMCVALSLAAGIEFIKHRAQAQDVKPTSGVPVFQADPNWPKLGNMKIGMLMGLAVDSHDHVWLSIGSRRLQQRTKHSKLLLSSS